MKNTFNFCISAYFNKSACCVSECFLDNTEVFMNFMYLASFYLLGKNYEMDGSLITTFDDVKEKYKINEIYTVPTYISFAE